MHKRFHLVGFVMAFLIFAAALLFGHFEPSDTVNTIMAAHRACDAQTGHRCD